MQDEFVSHEQRDFHFRIGTLIASSLAGFVAGVIFGAAGLALIWWAASQSAR